jgi:hypothetical protein
MSFDPPALELKKFGRQFQRADKRARETGLQAFVCQYNRIAARRGNPAAC